MRESLNARQVALDVIGSLSTNKQVNLYRIQRNNGYTHSSARAMAAPRTKTYKNIMSDFISQMKKIKDKNLKNLAKAVDQNDKATIRDYAYLDDLMTKNINLLEGKATTVIKETKVIETVEQAKEYLKEVLTR